MSGVSRASNTGKLYQAGDVIAKALTLGQKIMIPIVIALAIIVGFACYAMYKDNDGDESNKGRRGRISQFISRLRGQAAHKT
jgi:hypothetical protein